MAGKSRFFDVWIVESNTVYREVPFTVVSDWVQQGRLLEDDMLKLSGTTEWSRIEASTDFGVYLPKPEAFRSEDKAEALEPVQLDFSYKPRHSDEDDDVDMIPLIDVSLVLLIFFMLISAGAETASAIQVPTAAHPNIAVNPDELTVGLDLDNEGKPVYSLAIGNQAPADDDDRNIYETKDLLAKVQTKLGGTGTTDITVNANKDVRSGLVRQLTMELYRIQKVNRVLLGVNEKEQ
jgi:biopolymer transport protein ExbD